MVALVAGAHSHCAQSNGHDLSWILPLLLSQRPQNVGIEQAAHLGYVGGVTTPLNFLRGGEGSVDRITTNHAQCGGRPCVRGMRIRVTDVLDLLGEGLSLEQILEELPDLEAEDVRACVQFARRRVDHPVLAG